MKTSRPWKYKNISIFFFDFSKEKPWRFHLSFEVGQTDQTRFLWYFEDLTCSLCQCWKFPTCYCLTTCTKCLARILTGVVKVGFYHHSLLVSAIRVLCGLCGLCGDEITNHGNDIAGAILVTYTRLLPTLLMKLWMYVQFSCPYPFDPTSKRLWTTGSLFYICFLKPFFPTWSACFMVLKEFLIKCAEEWERLNAPISGFAGMFKVTTRLWNLLQDQWQYQNLGYLQGSNAAAHSVNVFYAMIHLAARFQHLH